jgi:predicted regulator of Ras-like GTPase activity (Roadblock/LC7/MglB family)
MAGLGEVVQALPDTVAALAATFGRQASALTEGLGLGAADTVALESGDRLAIAARLGAGEWLILLPTDGADAGALLHDLRRHRAALAALLA